MQDEQTEATVTQSDTQEEPDRKRTSRARKALPIVALLLLIALALNYETLRRLTTKPPLPAASAPQEADRSLDSPEATEKLLAKLNLRWTNPGPPVLVFAKRG